MTLIIILLVLSAGYCGIFYAFQWIGAWAARHTMSPEEFFVAERNTFHLGLCFILSLGFLGLLLK